jgi:hypothetical protein
MCAGRWWCWLRYEGEGGRIVRRQERNVALEGNTLLNAKRALYCGPYGRARPTGTAVSTAVSWILLTRKRTEVQLLRGHHTLSGQRKRSESGLIDRFAGSQTRWHESAQPSRALHLLTNCVLLSRRTRSAWAGLGISRVPSLRDSRLWQSRWVGGQGDASCAGLASHSATRGSTVMSLLQDRRTPATSFDSTAACVDGGSTRYHASSWAGWIIQPAPQQLIPGARDRSRHARRLLDPQRHATCACAPPHGWPW